MPALNREFLLQRRDNLIGCLRLLAMDETALGEECQRVLEFRLDLRSYRDGEPDRRDLHELRPFLETERDELIETLRFKLQRELDIVHRDLERLHREEQARRERERSQASIVQPELIAVGGCHD